MAIEMIPAWPFDTDPVHNWAYWDNAFSPKECKKIIEIGETVGLKRGKVNATKEGDSDARKSKVSWLYPSDDMTWAYRRVTDMVLSLNETYFKFDLFGMVEGFQFTKYEAPDNLYKLHMDKHFNGIIRKLSVTIQLSDPKSYEGGELAFQFCNFPDVAPKELGKLICFPSYIVHEVRPVTKGTRYSLVAWISGKAFK